MTTTAGRRTFLTKKTWVTSDEAVREWVNAVIWKILSGPKPPGQIKLPNLAGLPADKLGVFYEALIDSNLHGMAVRVLGDLMKDILRTDFLKLIVTDRTRTDFYLSEIDWVFSPKLGRQIIVFGDAAVRKLYEPLVLDDLNPRFVKTLTLWTPTLDSREQVTKLLGAAGYVMTSSDDEYRFSKTTLGIDHSVHLRGVLWESSKNWPIDLEHEIWDRAMDRSSENSLPHLEVTDFFMLSCRQFATETLMGSAIGLMDLVMILDHAGPSMDWERIRSTKNRLVRPYWLLASLMALEVFERKTGRKFEFPAWARTAMASDDGFWAGFVESRLCWANPDTKLLDFPRAQSKVTRGI